jgi:hypothetical protein
MVMSYWEMACSMVTAGVLNQELFLEASGEMLVVWEKARHIVPSWREFTKNPHSWHNLETVGNAAIERMESHGPGAYPAFQNMLKSMTAASAARS